MAELCALPRADTQALHGRAWLSLNVYDSQPRCGVSIPRMGVAKRRALRLALCSAARSFLRSICSFDGAKLMSSDRRFVFRCIPARSVLPPPDRGGASGRSGTSGGKRRAGRSRGKQGECRGVVRFLHGHSMMPFTTRTTAGWRCGVEYPTARQKIAGARIKASALRATRTERSSRRLRRLRPDSARTTFRGANLWNTARDCRQQTRLPSAWWSRFQAHERLRGWWHVHCSQTRGPSCAACCRGLPGSR